jgi:hypothetical protein
MRDLTVVQYQVEILLSGINIGPQTTLGEFYKLLELETPLVFRQTQRQLWIKLLLLSIGLDKKELPKDMNRLKAGEVAVNVSHLRCLYQLF